MSKEISADEPGDVLDWLYERGRQRAARMPEFDAGKSVSRARAAWDAGAVNFWNVLSPTERSHFESASHLRQIPPGTVLMREGEQAGEVIVIRDGWTKVTVREDGRERAIAEVIDALRSGRESELSARRALNATEIIFAIYESSRRRGRVDLPLTISDSPLAAMVEAGQLLVASTY